MKSAFYTGTVRHRRFHPTQHSFRYRMTLLYLDLDEIEKLIRPHWFWSDKKFNLGWLRREDYIAPHHLSIKDAVLTRVSKAGYSLPEQPQVAMLTNPRLWGFCFNPVTLYYVYEGHDSLHTIVAEVNNTPWLERHAYVLPVTNRRGRFRHRFDKEFHVSPFNPMDMHYQWISTCPRESLLVHMENHKQERKHMDATLTLRRVEWRPWRLNISLWTGPWHALWVPLAIYWQALKLFLKRTPVYDHPKSARARTIEKL